MANSNGMEIGTSELIYGFLQRNALPRYAIILGAYWLFGATYWDIGRIRRGNKWVEQGILRSAKRPPIVQITLCTIRLFIECR